MFKDYTVMLTLAALLLMTPDAAAAEATPADTAPAAPVTEAVPAPAPVSPEIANMRFCTAAMMVGQSMSANRTTGPNAAMMEALVGLLRGELTRLGDTDEAALMAERDAITARATTAGSLEALAPERERFERDCLPFLMNQR